jgi:4-hydroxy-tetrahydrodipicolinate synthase
VVAHISACATRDCIRLLKHARDHADAVLLLPPYYYARGEEAGVLAFFREVIAAGRLPVYLYNFPEHTQFEITPAMFRVLAGEFEHVAGIKDSGGRLDVSQEYKRMAPRLQVMVGSDRCALEVLQIGLDGSVTGCGNPVPEFLVKLTKEYTSGRHDEAGATQRAFNRFTTFREELKIKEIPLVKAALSVRIPGFGPYARPPFITVDTAGLERVRPGLHECLPK